jgi:hypothetical protein
MGKNAIDHAAAYYASRIVKLKAIPDGVEDPKGVNDVFKTIICGIDLHDEMATTPFSGHDRARHRNGDCNDGETPATKNIPSPKSRLRFDHRFLRGKSSAVYRLLSVVR